MNSPISITALSSLSALGSAQNQIWDNYLSDNHFITEKQFENFSALVAELNNKDKIAIETLRSSDAKYVNLDDSVLFAIYVSRKAVAAANWRSADNFGINSNVITTIPTKINSILNILFSIFIK